MQFKITFSDSVKCSLINVLTILFAWYSWILDKLFLKIKFSLCTFYSPATWEKYLLRFKLDPSVLYFITFFQMVILVGEPLSRERYSENCWTSLKLLVLRQFATTKISCSLVISCILGGLKNELIDWLRSAFIYILMVSTLLNNIHETWIAFQAN